MGKCPRLESASLLARDDEMASTWVSSGVVDIAGECSHIKRTIVWVQIGKKANII